VVPKEEMEAQEGLALKLIAWIVRLKLCCSPYPIQLMTILTSLVLGLRSQ